MPNSTLTRAMTPAELVTYAGESASLVHAMLRAERTGAAKCGDLRITHAGYETGANHFDASTSLFKVNV